LTCPQEGVDSEIKSQQQSINHRAKYQQQSNASGIMQGINNKTRHQQQNKASATKKCINNKAMH
jgi:hypothetical protein